LQQYADQEEPNVSKEGLYAKFKRFFLPLTEAEKREANIQRLLELVNEKLIEKSRIQSKIDIINDKIKGVRS